MSEPIRIPIIYHYYGGSGSSQGITITPDIARQIVALSRMEDGSIRDNAGCVEPVQDNPQPVADDAAALLSMISVLQVNKSIAPEVAEQGRMMVVNMQRKIALTRDELAANKVKLAEAKREYSVRHENCQDALARAEKAEAELAAERERREKAEAKAMAACNVMVAGGVVVETECVALLTKQRDTARDVLRETRPIVAAYLAHAESKGDSFEDKASRARYALVHIDAALKGDAADSADVLTMLAEMTLERDKALSDLAACRTDRAEWETRANTARKLSTKWMEEADTARAELAAERERCAELEGLLRDESQILRDWARESLKGGWSTHQVGPMQRRAAEIDAALGKDKP